MPTQKFQDIVKNSPQLTDDDKSKIIASNTNVKKVLMKSPIKNTNNNNNLKNSEGMKKLFSSPIKQRLCLENIKKKKKTPSDDEFISSDECYSPKKEITFSKKHSPKKELKGPDVKVHMKPLGFDEELKKWINSVKNNSVISETPVSFIFFSILWKI